ncbi:MAG: MATE family efflux transporter [Defluviitaleaceae bacterium]|nr:MATE family efflux transporter [Defluviitaleaceae bacterium]
MSSLFDKHKDEYVKRSKEFFGLTAPIFLEQTFVVMLGIVTTIMVSGISGYALSAVSMVDSIVHLVSAFFAALTVGATIVVAQYTGRGDHEKISGVTAQAILLAVVFGVVLCVVLAVFRIPVINLLFGHADYPVIVNARLFMGIIAFSFPAIAVMMTAFGVLRGSGNTRAPMVITIIINIINVALGLILIRGFGLAGAAIALLISRYMGALLGIVYILKRSKTIRFNGIRDFKPDFSLQKIILSFGIPTSIESGTFQMGKLLITIFIAGMGTAAIAANAIVSSIAGILNAPGMGFSTGAVILVGQRIGRGDTEDVRKTSYFSVGAAMVMLAILCGFTFTFMNQILSLYYTTDEMLAILRPVLVTLFIATPIAWPVSFVTPGALRATGDVKYTMFVAVASMVFVRIALAWVLGVHFGLGILGVWFSMYADWVVRGAFFLNRVRNGKWQGKGVAT